MMPRQTLMIVLAPMAVVLLAMLWGAPAEASSAASASSGVSECPKSPNCVSSADPQSKRYVEPFAFSSSPDEAFSRLLRIVGGMKRATVVSVEAGSIRAEFRSILGFVDDVELRVDAEKRVVEVRSASRLGYWDLGVNRRRIESIRAAFQAECR